MISKIENGLIDLPQSKIELLARALDTDPMTLIGWGDKSDSTIFEKYKNDSEFMKHIHTLFLLPLERKQFVYEIIRDQSIHSEEDKKKDDNNSELLRIS